MADREFTLKIVGDIAGIQKDIGQIEKDVSGFATNAGKIGTAVAGALTATAVIGFGKSIVDAASSTEQALGASQSVFGEYADDIEKFSDDTAKNLGLAKSDFLELSTLTGALLKNTGLPMEEVTDITVDLTERAADMAAMYGGTVGDALSAINSGLKGEADALESYGVSMNAAKVEAEALSLGLIAQGGVMTDAQKATATASLIMKQSADTAGTFADESSTLAGSTAIAKAQFSDLSAELGGKLLPMIAGVLASLMPLIDFLVSHADFILPIVAAIGLIIGAMKAWNVVQGIFNVIMGLNPVVAFALAIGALIALLVVAYMKVGWFRDFVDAAFDVIQAVVSGFVDFLGFVKDNIGTIIKLMFLPWFVAFEAIKLGIKVIPDAFFATVDAIKWIVGQVTTAITWPFEQASAVVSGIVDKIRGPFATLIDWFGTAFAKVKQLIEWPFTSAMDGIKWIWNHSIGGFGFDVPSWVPLIGGEGFHIPMLASGGIVTGPTLALIGESGPEAVVPLNQGFGSTVINVYALTANAEVGRVVQEALDEYRRTSGRVA